jgi:hypothetical protein
VLEYLARWPLDESMRRICSLGGEVHLLSRTQSWVGGKLHSKRGHVAMDAGKASAFGV